VHRLHCVLEPQNPSPCLSSDSVLVRTCSARRTESDFCETYELSFVVSVGGGLAPLLRRAASRRGLPRSTSTSSSAPKSLAARPFLPRPPLTSDFAPLDIHQSPL
jgi:hypothetical protein